MGQETYTASEDADVVSITFPLSGCIEPLGLYQDLTQVRSNRVV
jgi:hypothetical protein